MLGCVKLIWNVLGQIRWIAAIFESPSAGVTYRCVLHNDGAGRLFPRGKVFIFGQVESVFPGSTSGLDIC